MRLSRNQLAAGGALVLVVAGLSMGYRMLGPAQDQRAISADERRVMDLMEISRRLRASDGNELPADLSRFDGESSELLRDPLTKTPYEYARVSGSKYRLCAIFAFARQDGDQPNVQVSSFWNHPKGRYCYQLDATKFY